MLLDPLAQQPHPSLRITGALAALVIIGMCVAIGWLLSVQDTAEMKRLIEDSGPVQLLGQYCIGIAFCLAMYFAITDIGRRRSFLMLSYIFLFYTLREADYHYKVSPYAKATQVKRFYSHDMIPLSTKLLMATITVLLLVVLYRYARQEKNGFLQALNQRLPWAIFTAFWAIVIGISQLIDQIPAFHSVVGQVFEEVFESSAEILALTALVLFRWQVYCESKYRRSKVLE